MIPAADDARARAVAGTLQAMRRAVALADLTADLQARKAPPEQIAETIEAGSAALMVACAAAGILTAALEAIAQAERGPAPPPRPEDN